MLTAEQKEARRQRIGSTDVPKILGLSQWGSPLTVYAEKVHGIFDDSETLPMMLGSALEPVIRRQYEAHWGVETYKPDDDVVMHECGILGAQVDWYAIEQGIKRPVEAKTLSIRKLAEWGEEGTDEVPRDYLLQAMTCCGCTGSDFIRVAAMLRDDGSVRYYQIDFDQELFDHIVESSKRFWETYILPKVEPPAQAGDTKIVAKLYPKPEPIVKESNPKIETIAYRYAELMASSKALDSEKEHLKAQLAAHMGVCDTLITGSGTFTFKEEKRGRVFRFKEGIK